MAFFFEYYRVFQSAKKLRSEFDVDLIISRHYRIIPPVARAFKSTPHFYVIPGIAKYQQHVKKGHRKETLKFFLFKQYSNYLLLPLKHWFQWLSLQSTVPIVFSESVINQLRKAYPDFTILPIKLYPGVDSQRFTLDTNKPKNHFTFLIVGRLIKQKGIALAIEAFSSLASDRIKLVIVGDGPLKDELVLLRDHLGLREMIQFFGYDNRPENHYRMAHVFLMTSVHESFGQSIIEAFSSGLPVIAFHSQPGIVDTASSEIVKDNVNGFLCNYSVQDLASCMRRCLELTSSEYERISLTNRQEAEIKFSWNTFVDRIIQEASKK